MKSVKILGQKVPIKKVPHLEDTTDHDACYVYDDKEILIEKTLAGEKYFIALLHEMGHALFDSSGGGLKQAGIHEKVEEIIVQQFAHLIVDNFNLTPKR